MSTSETKENICLVCLEAPAVRKVETCEHSYCETCLSSPNFACPQCVTEGFEAPVRDCPIGGGKEAQLSGHGSQHPGATDQTKAPLLVGCRLCHFRGTTVKAVNICKECKSIPLCGKCSQAHRKNKATQNHVVTVRVAQRRDDAVCEAHAEAIGLFCTTCSINVCHICVSLHHENHEVMTFNDVVNTEVDKVRSVLKNEEVWLKKLKFDESELRQSKATAQEMEDALIKSIEDHAEKCIEEIIENREELKKQVKCDFEVVRVTKKRLEAMTQLERVSRVVAAAANSLLNKQAELHSTYVEKLVTLKQQLDKLKDGHPAYEEENAKCRQTFKELCEKAIVFYPRTPICNIGRLEEPEPTCDDGGPCVCETCERAFEEPDASREGECRERRRCVCGTCACEYNRQRLYENGKCASTTSLLSGLRCGSKITSYTTPGNFP